MGQFIVEYYYYIATFKVPNIARMHVGPLFMWEISEGGRI